MSTKALLWSLYAQSSIKTIVSGKNYYKQKRIVSNTCIIKNKIRVADLMRQDILAYSKVGKVEWDINQSEGDMRFNFSHIAQRVVWDLPSVILLFDRGVNQILPCEGWGWWDSWPILVSGRWVIWSISPTYPQQVWANYLIHPTLHREVSTSILL